MLLKWRQYVSIENKQSALCSQNLAENSLKKLCNVSTINSSVAVSAMSFLSFELNHHTIKLMLQTLKSMNYYFIENILNFNKIEAYQLSQFGIIRYRLSPLMEVVTTSTISVILLNHCHSGRIILSFQKHEKIRLLRENHVTN